MTRYLSKVLVFAAVVSLVAAACGKSSTTTSAGVSGTGPTGGGTGTPSASTSALPQGGTLNLALESDVSAAFDPQKEYYSVTWEFFRCCLLRTLMSYNGHDTQEHGAEVFPDLAAAAPTVSSDGLTWTFKLKPGIKYAPPLQSETVTSKDIVRALEREACTQCAAGGYSFYYDVIKGFRDYSSGKAKTISGLATPDYNTLVVTLTQPAGDLPFRFAMAATAPIPPNPNDPSAKLGVAQGHDKDYGRFLVATGPYMFQGANQVDFSQPAASQKPAAGYVPGKSITLVRNPSWDKSTDDLRLANVDQIDVQITSASEEDLAAKVDSGELDLVMDGVPPTDQLQKYETDPNLKDQVQIHPSDAVRYISFNLAQPPFDDVHVRKAINYAIDKNGLRKLRGGPAFGEIANHIIVDSLENNALQTYDPYPSANSSGDIAKAKDEMKQSKYDTNGDGVCDASVCKNVLTVIDQGDPYPQQSKLIAQNLAPLGITLDIKSFERTTMYAKCNDPTAHVALCTSPAWGKDYADAFTFGPPLFGSSSIGPNACCNYSLVGASSADLKKWNYPVSSVPSVDKQLTSCGAETGDQRVSCWTNVDKDLMENVVPWVPYLFDNNVDVFSSRIVNYQFDQFAGLMALDQVAVQG
jgi:peptide/nickel transport system substrate-binding protein